MKAGSSEKGKACSDTLVTLVFKDSWVRSKVFPHLAERCLPAPGPHGRSRANQLATLGAKQDFSWSVHPGDQTCCDRGCDS